MPPPTSKALSYRALHVRTELTHHRRYGTSLITFDPKQEAKLRRKIDFCIVPTVALLYLFCFIDRANIGSMLVLSSDLVLA